MQTSALRGSGEASPRRPSDRELIARFLASRDESAFAEIVARYSRLVMSVAVHTLRDPHAAEDAFQAAFLVLAKNARRIRNRDSLASWLHGTTYRVSHRLLRSRLRRKEQDLPSVEPPSPIWADPQRPDEQAALDEELSRLSDGLRGPLVLHYLEGRTVPEIAAELKMTQAAVEGWLKRGKKTLRKRLLRRGVLLSSAAFGAGLTVPAEAGVAGTLVTATVAACLKTTATTSLAPIAATTIQQIALQETAAMTRIALLKMALVCGGVAGAIGLAGAGANGTLGMAWANPDGGAAVTRTSGSQFDAAELPMPPTGVIQTALAQAASQSPNVDATVLTADSLQIGSDFTQARDKSASNADQAVRDHAREVLKSVVTVSATDKPLDSLLKELSKEHKVPIHVDGQDQQQIADLLKLPVSIHARGLRFESVLTSLLKELNLQHRIEDDGIHIGAAGAPAQPVNGVSQAGLTNVGASDALLIAAKQAQAKDQQIQALENMVRQLQVQVEQLREDQRRAKGPVAIPGTFDPNSAGGVVVPGNAPGGGLGVPGTEGVVGFGGGPAAQPGAGPALPPMGMMPSMAGMPAMPGGMAGMMAGAIGTPVPQRPKAVEELLKSADKQRAKAIRDYLSQLEGSARGGNSPRGTNAPPSGEIQEFRPQKATEERIRQTLDRQVDFQFTGQTLQEVMNFLAADNNIVIRLDTTALTKAGVGPDVEINLVITGISLRSALNLMLQDVGGKPLDYIVENDVMVVTTKEKADQALQTVVYDVSALGSIDPTQLEMIVERTVEPSSWEGAGGKGAIVPVDGSLVITTSRRLHDKVGEILQMLQQHAKARKPIQ